MEELARQYVQLTRAIGACNRDLRIHRRGAHGYKEAILTKRAELQAQRDAILAQLRIVKEGTL